MLEAAGSGRALIVSELGPRDQVVHICTLLQSQDCTYSAEARDAKSEVIASGGR